MRWIVVFCWMLVFSYSTLYSQQVPNALAFDGVNDYINLSGDARLKPSSNFTFEVKLNPTVWNTLNTAFIISSSPNQGYSLKFQSGNLIASVYTNNGLRTAIFNVSTLTGWHHIAFTYDGLILKLYIDGLEKANSGRSKIVGTVLYESNSKVILGAYNLANSQFYSGIMDELKVWNIVRTDNQIKSDGINNEISPATSNLIVYYRFNQGSAGTANTSNILADFTTNALHGILNNFLLNGKVSNWIGGYPLKPYDQANNNTFSAGSISSVKISWTRAGALKGGNGVVVFMAKKGAGTAVPDDNIIYAANPIIEKGSQIQTSGWYCVYNGSGTSVVVNGITSGSNYRVHVIEYQMVGTQIRYNVSSGINNPLTYNNYPPTTQASNLIVSSTGYYGANLSWTRGNGSGVALFACETSSGNAVPVDYTSYSGNSNFKSGTQIGTSGWYCIYNGTGSSSTLNGLLPGRTYRIMACEYNGSLGTEKYITTLTGNIQNVTTSDFLTPGVQASSLSLVDYTSGSLQINCTRGNGTKLIVFAKLNGTDFPQPSNNSTYIANANYGSGSQIGTSGWYCIYNNTGDNFTISNLTAGASYKIVALEYNGTSLGEKYFTLAGSNVLTSIPDYKAPTIQAANIAVLSKSFNTAEFSVTRGNGSKLVAFVSQSSEMAIPIANNTYIASEIYENGSQINGWYCIYNGSGATFKVSNLLPGNNYNIIVFEFNGNAGLEKYNLSVSLSNKVSFKTIAQTTIWNGSIWTEGTPYSEMDAIIAANYSSPESFSCKNLTINAGAILNVQPGSYLTVNGILTNNGSLKLLSNLNSAPTGSLITKGQIVNKGTMVAERYISPGTLESINQHWHLMSLPNGGQLVESSFLQDYVMRFVEKTNSWLSLSTGNTLKTCEGYLVKAIKTGGKKVVFNGTFNSGNYSINVSNTGPDAYHGYNLVGNPYPSAINWDAEGWTKQNITNTIWVWDPINQRYMTWNGIVGQNGGTPYIAAMQGFLIKVNDNAASGILGFSNTTRVHTSVSFQKNARIKPELMRIEALGNGLSDELVIYGDNSENDVLKMYSENTRIPQLSAKENQNEYSIYKVNPSGDKIIHLALSCAENGKYSIELKESNFSSYKYISLVDHVTGEVIDLNRIKKYDFNYMAFDDANRFDLLLSNNEAAISTTLANADIIDIKAWGRNQKIYVQTPIDGNFTFELYSIDGKKELTMNTSGKGEHIIETQHKGVYVLKISFQNGTGTRKVVVY